MDKRGGREGGETEADRQIEEQTDRDRNRETKKQRERRTV